MAGDLSIEPTKPISRPGSRPCDPSACLLAIHEKLQEIVASKLILDWSPEQISGWLKSSIRTTRACACPTKPFTAACSFKRAER